MENKLRILAVDDNAQIRNVMCRVLRDYDVVTCADGTEAMSILGEDDGFDVILSDMDMLPMSGADLYRALVEHHPALSERVVFVTGGGASKDQRDFLIGTRRPTISKPFRPEELTGAISAIVRSG